MKEKVRILGDVGFKVEAIGIFRLQIIFLSFGHR